MPSKVARSGACLAAAILCWPLSGEAVPAPVGWPTPDLSTVPDDALGRQVRFGRELVEKTPLLIGPEVRDPSKRYAGNNLACASCHLGAGTKAFAFPFDGVANEFPQYRPRAGKINTLADRLNGCMVRSMNGRRLPAGAPELDALVAYLGFLSAGVQAGVKLPGRGAGAMPELDRPADPGRGRLLFEANCVQCHGADGLGVRAGTPGDAQGYAVPPLWGPDAYNDGAGMNRLGNAANFIHSNMPERAIEGSSSLTAEDAWDVAAFIESQPRPHKDSPEKDFPDRSEKPPDAPLGPYVDGFSQQQHMLGPFAPIRKKLSTFTHRRRLFEPTSSSAATAPHERNMP